MLSKSYSLNYLFSLLGVNKNAYYHWLNISLRKHAERACFLREIVTIYADFNGIYGSNKIHQLLVKKGFNCSVSKVSKCMNMLGIKSIKKQLFPHRKSTMTDAEKLLIVNLVKGVTFTKINQAWSTDITYIQTINDGTLFLISFIDMFSRVVISWGLFKDQKTDKILSVLEMAIKKRGLHAGLIIHSDKGTQMRSEMYRTFLSKHNLVFSYTSLNHSCDENAKQESFHAQLKTECIYLKKLYTFEDAYSTIYEYIEGFYNPIRIHSSLGYLSPYEFEKTQKF